MSTASSTELRSIHQRKVRASARAVWDLVQRLGSVADSLWPGDRWPPLRLDRGIVVGSAGGHGPIRYHVTEVEEGKRVRFEFEPDTGVIGGHEFRVEPTGGGTVLVHELEVHAPGILLIGLILPMRDALLEDLLDDLETTIRRVPSRRRRLPIGIRARRAAVDVLEALSSSCATRSRARAAVTAAG